MIQSPLNYTGGKFKILPQILPLFPDNIGTFVDLFCGGCNVGINVTAERYIYNDIDEHLLYLFNTLKNLDKESTFEWIYQIIDQYSLSMVSENGYDYYGADSFSGLANVNRNAFLRMREDFNHNISEDYFYYIMLYVLIVYAFNNQLRFNANGEFNLPVGKRDFNSKMQEKLSAFIDIIQKQNCSFTCRDFREFTVEQFAPNDFIYCDPPYLITCATYNEKDGWNEQDELDLLAFLDNLSDHNIRFALSNVLRSKGRVNEILIDWTNVNAERYKAIHLNYNYSNSNYHTKDKESGSDEVLIINY